MAILGLILIVVAGVWVAAAFFATSDQATMSVLGVSTTMSVAHWVVLGALAGLVFAIGVMMLAGGMRRASRRRRATREVVVSSRTEAEELRAENERLARELEERRVARATAAGSVADGDLADSDLSHRDVADRDVADRDFADQGVSDGAVAERGVGGRGVGDPGVVTDRDGFVDEDRYVARHTGDATEPVPYPDEPTTVQPAAVRADDRTVR